MNDDHPGERPISVLLVDDHTLFRSGIRSLLQRHPEFDVVGEAADGIEGIKRAKQLKPQVVLLDLNMPGMSGLETLQLLLQDCPDSAVVMLTVSEDALDLSAALRAGAAGYLLKNIDTDYLVRAVRRAAAGETVVAEAMTGKLVAQLQAGTRGAEPASELDRLTLEALVTVDADRRAALLRQATGIAVEDAAIIPLYHQVNAWGTRHGLGYRARSDENTLAEGVVRAPPR